MPALQTLSWGRQPLPQGVLAGPTQRLRVPETLTSQPLSTGNSNCALSKIGSACLHSWAGRSREVPPTMLAKQVSHRADGRHRAQGTAGLPEATISWHSGDNVAHWLEGKWNEKRVTEVGKAEQAFHGTRDTWVVHLLSLRAWMISWAAPARCSW